MLNPGKWLKLQFRRQIDRGFITNAELNPEPTPDLTSIAEGGEIFVVRITSKKGDQYWLSSRGIFLERCGTFSCLFQYDDVRRIHWLEKDLETFLIEKIRRGATQEYFENEKRNHFDRLIIELADKDVVLEGLDQAYMPIFELLKRLPQVTL